jgi:hypothetical protein
LAVSQSSGARARLCARSLEVWRSGLAPEEIQQGLPHLTLAQVFGALSYYSDHQEEILRHIARKRIADEEMMGG